MNEKGTVAAAFTGGMGAGMMMKPVPIPVFRADRPFVFLIRDRRSGCLLFVGRLAVPAASDGARGE